MTTGILIGNLGTPRSPSRDDVKAYLKEFLMDPFVIDRPWWKRWLLVHGIIVPLRSKKSAAAYKLVWRAEGSPLLSYTELLTEKLRSRFAKDFHFEIGMRYGEPSIEQALTKLKDCSRILLCPQYPEYAESSYRTWMEEAMIVARSLDIEDKLISLDAFYAREEYLAAQTEKIASSLKGFDFDHLLLSFHGLPESHMKKLDPSQRHCLASASCCDKIGENNKRCYRAQCYFVARELEKRLQLKSEQISVSFQSRLGREPWIRPFTDHVIKEMPGQGIKKLAVAMPAFTVDCLETLEEIHLRARADFLQAGGEKFLAIDCLNDDDQWVERLSQIIEKSLASPVKPCP
jgi:protoporphyrin/coproporphyrin ferrochelatase